MSKWPRWKESMQEGGRVDKSRSNVCGVIGNVRGARNHTTIASLLPPSPYAIPSINLVHRQTPTHGWDRETVFMWRISKENKQKGLSLLTFCKIYYVAASELWCGLRLDKRITQMNLYLLQCTRDVHSYMRVYAHARAGCTSCARDICSCTRDVRSCTRYAVECSRHVHGLFFLPWQWMRTPRTLSRDLFSCPPSCRCIIGLLRNSPLCEGSFCCWAWFILLKAVIQLHPFPY